MKTKIFFMIYLEDGGAPTYKHESLASAEQEARRLAKKTGRKAYILGTIKSIQLNEFIVVDMKSEEELPF